MRVISPSGRLLKIGSAVPCVETQYELNGRKYNVSDIARDMTMKPTAIRFHVKDSDRYSDSYIYIGNLKPEQVQEMMQVILREKSYDLSKFEYQKTEIFEEHIIDRGESLPYFDEAIFDNTHMLNFHPRFEYEEDDE